MEMEDDNETKNVLLKEKQIKTKVQTKDVNLYTSKRFLLVILISFGYSSITLMRGSLNIALVEMTSKKLLINLNGTISETVELDLNPEEIGFILSVIYYGNVLSPVGGIMASRFGGSFLFGIGIALSAIITFLIPFFIQNLTLFCLLRFIFGTLQTCAMQGIPEIWSRWAPPNERSILTCLSGIGWHFGFLVISPVAGYIIKLYGWPFIFYVAGIFPLVWSIIWFFLVSNDPAEDKFISKAERSYLKETINRKLKDKVEYSWKNLFTCKGVWAFCIIRFTLLCGSTAIITGFPQYIKDILHVDIKTVGLISSAPHFCMILGLIFSSYLADYLRNSKILSPTRVHKLYVTGGGTIGALLFSATIFNISYTESIICISLHRFFLSFSEVTTGVIILDMAPRYASIITGISGWFSLLGAIFSPTFTGFIVKTHSVSEWNICFIVFSLIYVLGGVVFFLFGTGKFQTWSLPPEEQQKKKIQNECTAKV